MSGNNPFANEWRDCLAAHYQYVLAKKDTRNEASLRTILEEVGFAAEDLAAVREYYNPTSPAPEATFAEAEPALAVGQLSEEPSDAAYAPEPTIEAASDAPEVERAAPTKPKKKPKQLTLFG